MFKEKKAKNYIILAFIFLIGIGITLYLCNIYNVYDEYQKQTPVIRGTLSEITSEDLEHYLMENPTIIIYMCTSSSDKCRKYESRLAKLSKSKNLQEYITYLNLSDVDQDAFVEDFNEKHPYRVKLTTSYPALVTFEEGKVKYILQGNEKEDLTITKTKQYLALNHIGE